MARQTHKALIQTPVGTIQIHATDQALLRVELIGPTLSVPADLDDPTPFLSRLVQAIQAYIQGQSEDFRWVPLRLEGLPALHQRFYLWLREHVPYGTTRTYGEVATALGLHPRTVGRILAQNPFPIVVPCHRILGKNGLGGFSAGLQWKRFLLEIEGRLPSRASR